MLQKNEVTGAYICPHCGADLPNDGSYPQHTGRAFSCPECGAFCSGFDMRPGYFGNGTDGTRFNFMTQEQYRNWEQAMHMYEIVIVDEPDPSRRKNHQLNEDGDAFLKTAD